MTDKILFFAAIVSNTIMVAFALYLALFSYGNEGKLAVFLLIPPVLALAVIMRGEDREERKLRKAVRKATLRKQLKELEDFTK